jgi:hypothetical protein
MMLSANMQMRTLGQPIPPAMPALRQSPVQRPRSLCRLTVHSMESRPGFEPVEDGARRTIGTESQAVYEYSTHQGLKMEEIEDDDAEVRQLDDVVNACFLPAPMSTSCLQAHHVHPPTHRWISWVKAQQATCTSSAGSRITALAMCLGWHLSRTLSTCQSASCDKPQRWT